MAGGDNGQPTPREWASIVNAARKADACRPGQCQSVFCALCNLIMAIAKAGEVSGASGEAN